LQKRKQKNKFWVLGEDRHCRYSKGKRENRWSIYGTGEEEKKGITQKKGKVGHRSSTQHQQNVCDLYKKEDEKPEQKAQKSWEGKGK